MPRIHTGAMNEVERDMRVLTVSVDSSAQRAARIGSAFRWNAGEPAPTPRITLTSRSLSKFEQLEHLPLVINTLLQMDLSDLGLRDAPLCFARQVQTEASRVLTLRDTKPLSELRQQALKLLFSQPPLVRYISQSLLQHSARPSIEYVSLAAHKTSPVFDRLLQDLGRSPAAMPLEFASLFALNGKKTDLTRRNMLVTVVRSAQFSRPIVLINFSGNSAQQVMSTFRGTDAKIRLPIGPDFAASCTPFKSISEYSGDKLRQAVHSAPLFISLGDVGEAKKDQRGQSNARKIDTPRLVPVLGVQADPTQSNSDHLRDTDTEFVALHLLLQKADALRLKFIDDLEVEMYSKYPMCSSCTMASTAALVHGNFPVLKSFKVFSPKR